MDRNPKIQLTPAQEKFIEEKVKSLEKYIDVDFDRLPKRKVHASPTK